MAPTDFEGRRYHGFRSRSTTSTDGLRLAVSSCAQVLRYTAEEVFVRVTLQ